MDMNAVSDQPSPPERAVGIPDSTAIQVMQDVAQGKPGAADALLPLVYAQLRELAAQRMRQERTDHTLQATALVHEAYLRLVGGQPAGWASRALFFHAAAEAMRRILIEHARARAREKRGGKRDRVTLDVLDLAAAANPDEIVALEEAFARLEEQEPDIAAVVRLRFYAGLSVEEAAEALGKSVRTIHREWTYARAWLWRQLQIDA
jgi:RNA polymerase sigma factor (TIGR02999 family)